MRKYVVLEKAVGDTPLQVVERYRAANEEYQGVPMAYAGRLDPMASGKLLVLIGDECKKQKEYHGFDKEYLFSVLFGTGSDTGDVLGLVESKEVSGVSLARLKTVAKALSGSLALPYPKFSSKTVQGKPLHVWTLEGRLNEIEIPVATTHVHQLRLEGLKTWSAKEVYDDALVRINSIAPVTEKSKELGRDFRREEVRAAWDMWLEQNKGRELQVATFRCVASSGTYMRSLAEEIGRQFDLPALAFSIHRTKIGRYLQLPLGLGFWWQKYN